MTVIPWIDSLRNLMGSQRVSTNREELDAHSYDCWPVATKWRQQGKQPYRPEVIVRPVEAGEVSRLLAWAGQNGVPITPWGAGSAVTGAPLPVRGGITLDMSAMNRILAINETNLMVKVQAGTMGHQLEGALNARGYTLGHSPQSLSRSTVGGWIATRATGQFSSRYGGIEDLVMALTVVLSTGEIIETKLAPRAALGPDLRHLFIGSEGTLGIVTDAMLKISPLAPYRHFEAIAFDGIEPGLKAMRRIMCAGLRPAVVRFYDTDEAPHAMRDPSFGGCVLFLGFEGIEAVAEAEYRAGIQLCQDEGGRLLGSESVVAWMERRFDFSQIENVLAQPGGLAETIEIAHFWDDILETYWALKKALAPLASQVWGHFSHVYPQGTSLYMILLDQTEDAATAERRLMEIWEVSMGICLEMGASIAHHHGVGLVRRPYLRQALNTTVTVLERVKNALDPHGIMNPGKLVF